MKRFRSVTGVRLIGTLTGISCFLLPEGQLYSIYSPSSADFKGGPHEATVNI